MSATRASCKQWNTYVPAAFNTPSAIQCPSPGPIDRLNARSYVARSARRSSIFPPLSPRLPPLHPLFPSSMRYCHPLRASLPRHIPPCCGTAAAVPLSCLLPSSSLPRRALSQLMPPAAGAPALPQLGLSPPSVPSPRFPCFRVPRRRRRIVSPPWRRAGTVLRAVTDVLPSASNGACSSRPAVVPRRSCSGPWPSGSPPFATFFAFVFPGSSFRVFLPAPFLLHRGPAASGLLSVCRPSL